MTRTAAKTARKPASGAQTDALTDAQADAAAAPKTTPTPRAVPPRLGEMVHVVVAEGLRLKNNETGAFFEAGKPTPQTVTVTTLRRLADGDLCLAA